MPENINATDTSSGWFAGKIKLHIEGRVLQADGEKPAADIVLYYWHTDDAGLYTKGAARAGDGNKHGELRGWVKTDEDGRYSIFTSRPAPYPGRTMPAHIHMTVKEPDLPVEYWIDDFVFEGDELLTPEAISAMENRCGSGILKITTREGVQYASRGLILGRNIPAYPVH